jgi:hypothetical protein
LRLTHSYRSPKISNVPHFPITSVITTLPMETAFSNLLMTGAYHRRIY